MLCEMPETNPSVESLNQDQPVQFAQADLGRNFGQLSAC